MYKFNIQAARISKDKFGLTNVDYNLPQFTVIANNEGEATQKAKAIVGNDCVIIYAGEAEQEHTIQA